MRRAGTWFCVVGGLCFVACSDGKGRTEERKKAIEAAKAARAEPAPDAGVEAPKPPLKLEPFWDDPAYLTLVPDGACPEGMWALFPGDAPGADAAQKKANGAKRSEHAAKLRAVTLLVKLRAPQQVKLLEYDAPKGQFPLEVVGGIDCQDSFGRIAIGWATTKANAPGASAAKRGAEVTQNVWQSEPLTYYLPMRSQTEAKEFFERRRFDLHARVIIKLGKIEVDRKIHRTSKQTSGEVTIGGGAEDWGAGRMVRAELLGMRLATEQERSPLIENRAGR